jgi:DNA-binding transcriptional MerR regulator
MVDTPDVDTQEASPDDPLTWPGRRQAAQMLGIMPGMLDRLVRKGRVRYVEVGGLRRYCPQDLDTLTDVEERNSADEVVASTTAALRAANAHAESMIRLLVEPSERVLAMLSEENKALRARCAQLEDRHVAMLEAHEKAVSAEHERKLVANAVLREQDRADQAAKVVLERGPLLIEQFMMGAYTQKFLGSITPNQLDALSSAEHFLTDEQKVWIDKIRDRIAAKEAAKAKTKDEDKRNNQPAPEKP